MPELPEVETVKRALDVRVAGLSIVKVEIFSPAMRTSLAPLAAAGLEGRRILGVRRRGRYMVMDLEGGKSLLMHLGMSGVLRVEPLSVPRRKHEHIFFHLSDGSALRFECTRRFSICEPCVCSCGCWPAALNKLGVEPLSDDFNADYLFNASRGHTGSIKNFLMDNAIVVGVGNIYAAETLFSSGISPLRRACDITRAEAEKLVDAVKGTLEAAIRAGGSSIRDYRHLDGSEGSFSLQLKAYGRAGEPCPVCGTAIAKITQSGRSSYYCPKCQK
ncbi:MAG: bifunctional DNA-formamidopyrimidine glycosylase/DNA-(apurinic or apyrimidinic site) lyase [Victivallaceae bacterium]|nr:bifunctional DNA-formamidopyrimidine glycosylase/DNA-(apurinic or apyrimidinic site) lyase [Victivallaceae bacterium]